MKKTISKEHFDFKRLLLLARMSCLLLFICSPSSWASEIKSNNGALQQAIITGRIIDETGEGLPGVNITVKGTTIGVMSDIDGNYSIDVPENNPILVFSFIGYTPQEIAVENKSVINITLKEDIQMLEEVVVVGYGTQTRRQITGSVSNVTESSFTKGVTSVATDLLKGKVSGLMVNVNSGDVTANTTLQLRGVTTLLDDEGPLIVIDGIPGGTLNSVSPSDIESISVLKDASSAAIYGSRAASGVILVTTKKGTGNMTVVNYDAYVSLEKIANKPDLLNADEWRSYASTNNLDTGPYDRYNAGTDWVDEVTRTGFTQNQYLSMAGGSNRSNYRISYTYQDRAGIMRDNNMDSHNFRFQVQQRALNDKLRLGLSGSVTSSNSNPATSGNFILAYNMLPVYPVFNSDGTYFTEVNGEYDQGNPVQNQDLNSNDRHSFNYYGTGDLQYTIVDGLNAKVNIYKSRSINHNGTYNDSTTEEGMGSNGSATKSSTTSDRTLSEWTINYDRTFGNSTVQAIGGYSWEYNVTENFSASNRDFLSNELGYNDIAAGLDLQTGDVISGKSAYTLISMFSRAYYGYDDRYMVTAMFRRDGSSKFGDNNKWGLFPSFSVAWGISEEEFVNGIGWIDELKLRTGWGQTGNQTGLSPYRTLQLYSTSDQYYDAGSWKTAYAISQNANEDLRWETTTTANIGLDFSLFRGRLSGTLEWYNKVTSDMLYTYTVPSPPYVYSSIMANVGDMRNRGIEALLNFDLVKGRDFSYDISLNGSYNNNTVLSLSNELYETDRVYTGRPWIRGGSGVTSHVLEEGKPIGQFFMLICEGIGEDGKYILKDLNNDGNIDDADRDYCGEGLPDIVFGWNNNFMYKNFDLSVFFRGTIGNEVLNNIKAAYGNNTYLIGTNALNNEDIYRLTESSKICSYYIEDGSFIRLDNLSFGYTFNTTSIPWLDKARLYFAAQNLFILTSYTGMDPEVSLGGLAPGIESRDAMPRSKTFTFGFNLSF